MFCLDMLAISLELAREDPAYEDVASKFFEHFVYIAQAMNDIGAENMGQDGIGLWDEKDGFYYDVLHLGATTHLPMKVRSMVGLIPLFAVETFEPEDLARLPSFRKRMEWFMAHNPDFSDHVDMSKSTDKGARLLLTIANRPKLERIYKYLFDENEFLSRSRHPRAFEIPQGSSVRVECGWAAGGGGLRTCGIDFGSIRREFELARADLVPAEFPDDRVAAARALLLRR